MCGEKDTLLEAMPNISGSPPHVRGKATLCVGLTGRIRITPACAGKSNDTLNHANVSTDHPRMCGEKHTIFCLRIRQQGSPPHVRGKD